MMCDGREPLPWCCAHKWTLGYITVVVTLELFLILYLHILQGG